MNYQVVPTLLLGGLLFWLGCRICISRSGKWFCSVLIFLGLIASLPGVIYAIYYLKLFHEPVWLYEWRSLPFSELAAGGSGFIAGYFHKLVSGRQQFNRLAGRAFFPGVLLLGLLIPYLKPMLRPLDRRELKNQWIDNVCVQSTASTCGPACCATILRAQGKLVEESEIARDAFTSASGTENWYLSRTLRRRGAQVSYVLQSPDSSTLPFPAIAGVLLKDSAASGHFIAILNRVGDTYTIGDPMAGRLLLTFDELRQHCSPTGFFMIVK